MSACSWSPLALCLCQFLKTIIHLPPQTGRSLNGRDKEELLAGNQSGSCLSQSPGFPAFYTTKFPTQKWSASSSYIGLPKQAPTENHGSSCPEMGGGSWCPQRSWDHLSNKLLKTLVGPGTSGQDATAFLTHHCLCCALPLLFTPRDKSRRYSGAKENTVGFLLRARHKAKL